MASKHNRHPLHLEIIETVFRILRHIAIFAVFLLLFPWLLVMSIISRIYRRCLQWVISSKTHGEVMFVSGADAIWLQDTKENPATINTLMFMKGKADIKHLQEIVLHRLVKAEDDNGRTLFPKMTRYATKLMHRYIWAKEEEFDIEKHVCLRKCLPSEENKPEVEKIIGAICSEPLPEKLSPWQVIMITQKEGSYLDKFFILLRVHHSIGDGISILKLVMQKLVDIRPPDDLKRTFGTKVWLKEMIAAIIEGPAILLEKSFSPTRTHALHGPMPMGQKVIAWSNMIPLSLVKQIKNKLHATVNDVLMACLAGAFRNYFISKGFPVPSDMAAYVPVDIRPHDDSLELDNQFALVFLQLPLDIEDALERLQETKYRMDKIKRSPEALTNNLMIRYFMNCLPNWLTQLSFDWFSTKCSLVLSNIPGPDTKLLLCSNTIESVTFWPPQRSHVGLGVSIISYVGEVRIGVMVDRVITEDPDCIVVNFVEEVNSLASSLGLLEEADKENCEGTE